MASASRTPRRLLFALEDTGRASQEIQQHFHRILTPLSLRTTSSTKGKASAHQLSDILVSPEAHEEVPVPITLSALMRLVRTRLQPGPQQAHARPQYMRAFRDIILTHVKYSFKDLQHSLHDPDFSTHRNRELYQHLVTYMCLVCQQLFQHYLDLMELSRIRHIFTNCANLIRFSAQLSLDCSSFLNVATVRHRLVREMKNPLDLPTKSSSLFGPMTACALGSRLGFTISYYIRHIRPHMPTEKEKIARDIKELEELPLLDMNKIKQLNLSTQKKTDLFKQMSYPAITIPCPYGALGEKSKPQGVKHVAFRSKSLPSMRVGKLLADELGIHLSPRLTSPNLPYHHSEDTELKGPAVLAEDLRWLVHGSISEKSPWKREQDDDLDLPPLIKVLVSSKSNEARQLQLQSMIKALMQEESSEMKRKNTIIAAPASHPQATTVNVKIHDRMVVKAADLQVSERNYLETLTMEQYPPIYNHLLGEISSATMKSLDANLSTGEEVKEIYKELMNTVPADHLMFDQGPLIQSPASTLDYHSCFASSTLTKKKDEQIINEELRNILPAGPFQPKKVADSSQSPNLSKRLPSKEHASWLKWWKTTFNTDEFLKYISHHDADYLQVIFHLYNPEEGEAEMSQKELQPVLDEAEVKKQKVKREQLKAAELKSQAAFHSGMWNVSAIKLWGSRGDSFPGCEHKLEDLRVLQRRLERLWTVLHFPERERLDMAIKYSSNQYYSLLPDMLSSWEVAAQSIQDRELLLAEMEEFEQAASDPNRLFSKEPGSFGRRIQESKYRKQLCLELDQYNTDLQIILNHIKDAFNDTVTFKGRPYLEKMEWDKVEMLYWLQQERRARILKKAAQRRGQRSQLSPIT